MRECLGRSFLYIISIVVMKIHFGNHSPHPPESGNGQLSISPTEILAEASADRIYVFVHMKQTVLYQKRRALRCSRVRECDQRQTQARVVYSSNFSDSRSFRVQRRPGLAPACSQRFRVTLSSCIQLWLLCHRILCQYSTHRLSKDCRLSARIPSKFFSHGFHVLSPSTVQRCLF
jgi:hypothetical protein